MTAPTDPQPASPGQLLGDRYRLDRPCGRGGMGTVWLAHDAVLDRPVAVKEVTYPSVVSADERALLEERTMREARAAARLSSPRTTTVHDVVVEGGRPWIVMEYVESRTLREQLDASGPLPPVDAARIGLDLLEALEAAHAADVVHRDIKPGNVLLDAEGRAWLTDFGIATSVADTTLTDPGVLLGSPSFMAPERARGEEVGPFTDLWSLGATLYAAVEGHGPFDRGETLATLLAVTTEPPTPPQRAGSLGPVLLALLVAEPERRMTGWQARTALQRVIADAHPAPPPAAPAPPTTPMPASPPPTAPPPQAAPQAPPPVAPRLDSIARIDRADIARLASTTGRTFAKGAARAAVAGLNAWEEHRAGPGETPRPVSERLDDARATGRRVVRRSVLVLSLTAGSLLLLLAVLVVIAVLALQ